MRGIASRKYDVSNPGDGSTKLPPSRAGLLHGLMIG